MASKRKHAETSALMAVAPAGSMPVDQVDQTVSNGVIAVPSNRRKKKNQSSSLGSFLTRKLPERYVVCDILPSTPEDREKLLSHNVLSKVKPKSEEKPKDKDAKTSSAAKVKPKSEEKTKDRDAKTSSAAKVKPKSEDKDPETSKPLCASQVKAPVVESGLVLAHGTKLQFCYGDEGTDDDQYEAIYGCELRIPLLVGPVADSKLVVVSVLLDQMGMALRLQKMANVVYQFLQEYNVIPKGCRCEVIGTDHERVPRDAPVPMHCISIRAYETTLDKIKEMLAHQQLDQLAFSSKKESHGPMREQYPDVAAFSNAFCAWYVEDKKLSEQDVKKKASEIASALALQLTRQFREKPAASGADQDKDSLSSLAENRLFPPIKVEELDCELHVLDPRGLWSDAKFGNIVNALVEMMVAGVVCLDEDE